MWAVLAALFFLQAADPVADGQKALSAGRYEEAVQDFTQAVTLHPQDYFSHFNLALALGFLKRDPEAVAEYRKTLELKPGLYEAEANAGILLLRDKEPAEALPLLEAAAGQKPSEFQPRFHLAEAELDAGAPEKSEADFRKALELDAKCSDCELGLGRALAREDKLAEAAPHFQQAAAMTPAHRNALLELAGLYDKAGAGAEAIALYRQFPENAAAQQRIGELLVDAKQYGDAVARLQAAYAKDPTAANRTLLAQAYVLNHQPGEAEPLLAQNVAADPGNFDLRMMYARALRDLRRFPEAVAQFEEAAKLKPADGMVWSEMAASRYFTPDVKQTLADLDRARDLGENTAGNWFLRAILLDKLSQSKQALEAYQRFLSMSQGKNPDQEFQARQRARAIQLEMERR
ncbi:MAG TPA: tetratricopeptide repeat protein [Bryobacteraceae bacterium]|nr:tetratricopeptide repeat protein [Bryobacteraceae bacterium]